MNRFKEVYYYYGSIGLQVKYMAKTSIKKDAFILASIHKRTGNDYDKVLRYGIEHSLPIGVLSSRLPIIMKSINAFDSQFELEEGYKYSGEEKRRKYKEWLIAHNR